MHGGHLQKTKKEYKNLWRQETHNIFVKKKLACLQHDIAYGDFKDLTRFKCLLHY